MQKPTTIPSVRISNEPGEKRREKKCQVLRPPTFLPAAQGQHTHSARTKNNEWFQNEFIESKRNAGSRRKKDALPIHISAMEISCVKRTRSVRNPFHSHPGSCDIILVCASEKSGHFHKVNI